MGVIASTNNMPSAKFQSPKNLDTIRANRSFTVKLAVRNLATGNFVNAAANYFSAPQTVNSSGNIIGHSHVVIEKINGLSDTSVTDPSRFAFFKGLNEKAQDGVLSVEVIDGLPVGAYRIASINSAANHQPVLVAVAQHGALDDMVYVRVFRVYSLGSSCLYFPPDFCDGGRKLEFKTPVLISNSSYCVGIHVVPFFVAVNSHIPSKVPFK